MWGFCLFFFIITINKKLSLFLDFFFIYLLFRSKIIIEGITNMKKYVKLVSFLSIMAMLVGCAENQKSAPTVLNLDLSNAIALFNGNGGTRYEDRDEIEQVGWGLFKTDENGITKRVPIKTKRSDDDKFFKENNVMVDPLEVSDEYFFARIGGFESKYNYLINKKTGKALKIEGQYHFSRYGYWFDSTNPIRDFSKDDNNHIFGRAYDYKLKSDVIVKLTITDNKVKTETIGKTIEDEIDRAKFNSYAADKDGNLAYIGLEGTSNLFNYYFVTADNKVIRIDKKKGFWTGYDGAIYAYSNGNIEKLTYNKEKHAVDTAVVRSYPELKDLDLIDSKILYIDNTKQIYAYSTGENYEFVLYQIYGDDMAENPYVYTTDDFSYPTAKDSYFMQNYGYSHSGVDCDEDSIYVTTYDGSSFVINRLDTSNNMEHSQIRYKVDYNDGSRFLNNKKMLVFYWNTSSEINCPPGKSTASMSVGIIDLKTGELTKQNRFVTGNSNRSSVINLKSYK